MANQQLQQYPQTMQTVAPPPAEVQTMLSALEDSFGRLDLACGQLRDRLQDGGVLMQGPDQERMNAANAAYEANRPWAVPKE